jgi:hypothetical protein
VSADRCTTHHYACECREAKFAALERENAALRKDKERLDWQERFCVFLAVESSPEEYQRISPTRQGVDAARREAKP